jgi:4-hydroxybenzoate polyprenyltransferase
MRALIGNIARSVRWSDWGPGKIPVLCTVVFYIGMANGDVSPRSTLDFVLFIVFAALHSALGYVVNDWGDRELDAQHGKPNAFVQLSQFQGLAALGALLGLAILSALPFIGQPMVLPLWLAWAFVAPAYSLKPLRLKERGAWGLAFSFVAQWSLPILLAFAALNRFGGWDMVIFAVTITINGATLEIAHQRWDRTRDLGTETGTLGSRRSAQQMDRLYTTALYLDKAALGAIIATIAWGIGSVSVGSWPLPLGLPLLAIYSLLLAFAIYETFCAARHGELLDPYYSTGHSASKLLHETLNNLIIPTYLIFLTSLYAPINGLVLFAFLFWRVVLGQADWLWPLRAAIGWLQKRKQTEASS